MLLEERMDLDRFGTLASETLGRVAGDKTSEYGAGLVGEVVGEDERVTQNLVIHLVRSLCVVVRDKLHMKKGRKLTIVERRQTGHHLVQEDAECPPVNGTIYKPVSPSLLLLHEPRLYHIPVRSRSPAPSTLGFHRKCSSGCHPSC
jgi:hypothetical protein